MTTALESILNDLNWRENEIACVRILLRKTSISPLQRKALLRAAWAMLYAHYEGFCKEALTIYYDAIESQGVLLKSLPRAMQLFAVDRDLTKIKKLSNDEFYKKITGSLDLFDSRPSFPEVNTESNLWPNVLKSLLEIADLNSSTVEANAIKLKTLVERRNDIAHGKNNIINDVDYYLTYEEIVYDVMYNIALAIDDKLKADPFNVPD